MEIVNCTCGCKDFFREYAAADHNPDNSKPLPVHFESPAPRSWAKEGDAPVGRARMRKTFSWKTWNRAMGIRDDEVNGLRV
jgi:hypothetical protein